MTATATTTTLALQLLRATRAGDFDTVQRLVLPVDDDGDGGGDGDRGGIVVVDDGRDSLGRTALHEACRRGHHHLVPFLLRHGSNANATSRGGWRPLHHAVRGGGDCRRRGGNDGGNDDDGDGSTHRRRDDTTGATTTIDRLLRSGADIDARLRNGQTALHVAACHGDVVAVRALVRWSTTERPSERGGDDHDGDDHRDTSSVLLAADRRGWTALHLAAHHGRVDAVKYLLSLSSSTAVASVIDELVDATTHEGYTAFSIAAKAYGTVGRTSVLRLLLEYCQKRQQQQHQQQQQQQQQQGRRRNGWSQRASMVDREDGFGRTALHDAILRHDMAMIRFLLFTAGATVRFHDIMEAVTRSSSSSSSYPPRRQEEGQAVHKDDAIYALTTAAVPQGLLFASSSSSIQAKA